MGLRGSLICPMSGELGNKSNMTKNENKLKLCNIGWANSPHVSRLLRWLAAKGHEVHVITNQPIPIEGVKVYDLSARIENKNRWERFRDFELNVSWKWLRSMAILKRIRKLVYEISPDILHSHSLWYPGYLGVYLNVHPYVVSVFNGDVLWEKEGLNLYERLRTIRAIKKADLVLGESKTLIEAAIRRGADARKSFVFKIGVDLKIFNQQGDRLAMRRKLNLPGNKNIILSPRTIDPLYNLKTLIHAVPRIIVKAPNTLFIFIGHYVNAEYHKELEIETQNLGIKGNIMFIGKVEHAQVADYHRASDVFVSVSPKDSGPIALQEAMACGAAPVISDLPSVRELVTDGYNGLLINPQDPEQIAEAIVRLLGDDKMRKDFAVRNWEIVQEKCDQEKEMKKVEDLYYQLLEEARK